MFRNYFKIALRNISRHKGYSAINIAGLAIGIAACLLLFLVVRYEITYDKYNSKFSRIYRVVTQDKYSDGLSYNPGVPCPLLDVLRVDMPQLTFAGLDAHYGSQITVLGRDATATNSNKKFIESSGLFFVEPQFFDILDYTWLSGTPAVLKEPNMSVLTKSMAEKYFGNWQDAVGQFIRLDNNHTMKVAGVLTDPPGNTDWPVRVLSSYETLRHTPDYGYNTEWGSTSSDMEILALLPPNVSPGPIDAQLKAFAKKRYNDSRGTERQHYLQPSSDFHFDSRFGNFGDHVINKATLWTLSLIGLLIIVMASINFVNLSTAQAIGRSKEVGVRKVLGGSRPQLFWQMMGETTVIVIIAMLLALAIAKLVLPYLKNFVSIQDTLPLFSVESVLFLFVIALFTILLSGLYPSMVLSGFSPALALKNKITSATIGGISIRRGLVIMQFAISQIMIIGTIVAISQMSFVRNADLGFNKDAVLALNGRSDSALRARQAPFKEALLAVPGVQSVSFNSDVPSSDNNAGTNFSFDNKPDEAFTLFHKFGDADYIKTFGLQLVAGRSFIKSDTVNEAVINETLVRKLGLKKPEDAIGKNIRTGRSAWVPIVGVVKDFKTNSLREEVRPIRIASMISRYRVTAIKLHTSNMVQTQAAIKAAWEKFYPEYAYESFFVDESIARFYRQEEQLSSLYKIFAGLAIFISCLGLYGLVSFMAVQKTKEVGVRKVLGASIGNIVYLFSKEFTILIGIAFIIATPVAYFIMKGWLQDFVYRIDIGIGVFFIAIMVSLVIAWLTVGYKAVRAALVNPVKSLRSE